jgi:diaminopimelate decarboxylase
VLLTRVEYLKLDKEKRFAVVDASMSELIRPALYESWHDIVPVDARAGAPRCATTWSARCANPPTCSASIATSRSPPGDLLAILAAGAYGMAMASNYNTRPRPCEVLIDGGDAIEVRARESVESIYSLERTLAKR